MDTYYYWLIIAIVFVVIEIATVSFGAICFAFGAVASSIVSYFNFSFSMQLGAFAIVSFLAFLFVRPVLMKLINTKDEVTTNADAIIGRKGIVSEEISAENHTGRVSIDGDDWKAIATDGTTISKGSEVEVLSRDSLIITVRKI